MSTFALDVSSTADLPVSLLVPKDLLRLLSMRRRRHNSSLRLLLSDMIRSAAKISLPRGARVNTCYQNSGLDLVRLNVRISPSLWCQFRCLARSCGVSACYLFVFLLKQDDKDVGTPTYKQLHFREIVDLVKGILQRELKIWSMRPG